MNDWKKAVEHIGFQRCCYEKLDHIHCMAFRKTLHREDYGSVTDMSACMYIPQDYNTKLSAESDLTRDPKAKKQKIDDG